MTLEALPPRGIGSKPQNGPHVTQRQSGSGPFSGPQFSPAVKIVQAGGLLGREAQSLAGALRTDLASPRGGAGTSAQPPSGGAPAEIDARGRGLKSPLEHDPPGREGSESSAGAEGAMPGPLVPGEAPRNPEWGPTLALACPRPACPARGMSCED